MEMFRRNLWFRGLRRAGLARLVVVAVALSVSGCGIDPDESAKVEQELRLLQLIANGAEDFAQGQADFWVLNQALLADVLQWAGSRPSTIGEWQSVMYSVSNRWHVGRVQALQAEERLVKILGTAAAEMNPIMAQVRWARGLAELYFGMTFCGTALDGAHLTDTQWLRMAESTLTTAIESARNAGQPVYLAAARAGRAQARMLLQDWAGAESDAMSVPAGFSYNSFFGDEDPNFLVTIATSGEVGLLHKWWPLVEESDEPGFMIDPWSGERDLRIPVHFAGERGADGETPLYRQRKYDSVDDDIPIVHYDLAQLIIAEAKAVGGDYAGATEVLNRLRSAVGLPPHDTPTSAEEMEELILWERFAELHLEGQRLIDLHRKGLMEQVFEELNDPERPGVGRPSKWGCTDQP